MLERKKRILWVGESSFLSTGFSTYSLEVLKRLHMSGKYEVFELGSFGKWGDPRGGDLPWHYMSCMPRPEEEAEFNKKFANRFGEFRFEEACLWSLCDFCVDCRDWWYLEYQGRSPFRKFFNWAIMPTVDSYPQNEQWLATYSDADAVFAYNDWSLSVLQQESCGRIKTCCAASPGADIETLQVRPNKAACKAALGLPEDSLVIGTVMRNQRRKLYPDLCEAFVKLLETAPPSIKHRAVLYLHTAYPDLGWDVPLLLKRHGIMSRTYVTYRCTNCGHVWASLFQDAKVVCRQCSKGTAFMPGTSSGIKRADLGAIMSAFDVYVQYANSEGFGMPMVEAAACGVPVMAIDFSAMSDVVRKLGGTPLQPRALSLESETHCYRAVPDNDATAATLSEFLMLPESARAARGYAARRAVEEHYTYDKTASTWMEYIDSVAVRPASETWTSPLRLHTPPPKIPMSLPDSQFVRWCIEHVAGRPDLVDSYMALRLMRDLNWQSTTLYAGGHIEHEDSHIGASQQLRPFNREKLVQELLAMAEHHNKWERRRGERMGVR